MSCTDQVEYCRIFRTSYGENHTGFFFCAQDIAMHLIGRRQPEVSTTVTESWGGRRGICQDYRNMATFVRADVETTAKHIAGKAIRWDRNVLVQPVRTGTVNSVVFQLREHEWSEILNNALTFVKWTDAFRTFQGESIHYSISDTCGSVGYAYYKDGEILEEFFGDGGGRNRPNKATSRFSSKLRSVTLKDIKNIKNIWDFANEFFQTRGLYDPGLSYEYFLPSDEYVQPQRLIIAGEPSHPVGHVVANPGIQRSDNAVRTIHIPIIERIDHLVFHEDPRNPVLRHDF